MKESVCVTTATAGGSSNSKKDIVFAGFVAVVVVALVAGSVLFVIKLFSSAEKKDSDKAGKEGEQSTNFKKQLDEKKDKIITLEDENKKQAETITDLEDKNKKQAETITDLEDENKKQGETITDLRTELQGIHNNYSEQINFFRDKNDNGSKRPGNGSLGSGKRPGGYT